MVEDGHSLAAATMASVAPVGLSPATTASVAAAASEVAVLRSQARTSG